MNRLWHDLRYALRQLLRSPIFALTAVITLGLGIGANTAIFSVMNAVLLRYLPVPNPSRIVYLQTSGMPEGAMETGNSAYTFNFATFEQLRSEPGPFSSLIAFVPLDFDKVPVRIGRDSEEARGDVVSGNFFSGLGVRIERGRALTLEDEAQHNQNVVLSYDYWTRRFNRDPSVIGLPMYVKSVAFTIIGIAQRDFVGVEPDTNATDFWIPFQTDPRLNPYGGGNSIYGSPHWWFLMIMGRLQPGVTWPQALAQLNPKFQRAAYEGTGALKAGERSPRLSFSATGGIAKLQQSGENQFTILMTMVALVLLIACLNVAMLLMARNAARLHDFSMRVALGAGRAQFFRQLLIEALLLASCGALLAWSLASISTPVFRAWAKLGIPVAPDGTVLAFTLTITLLVALVLGLAPLPGVARANASLVLKPSSALGTYGRSRFRGGSLVMALQIGMCLVLLVGTGLLVRTLLNLQNASLGFTAPQVLLFDVTPPKTLRTRDEDLAFRRSLMSRLHSLPGVESATAMANRIGSGVFNSTYLHVDGANPEASTVFFWYFVGPDFGHTLGIPLLQGREFNDADLSTSAKVALINKTFADRYLSGRNPVGHQVQMSPFEPATIIGVAADSKYTDVREEATPTAYLLFSPSESPMTVALRTRGNPMNLLPEVRGALADLNPDLALLQPTTLQAQFEDTYSDERLFARITLFFGLLALVLVATGLYGTLAYRVSRRTAEIGVRMALGAQPRQALGMIMRESLIIGGIGLCLGLPFAFLSVRLLQSTLYHLSLFDPVSFLLAIFAIVLVISVAAFLPARRAAKVDPIVALRYE